MIGDYILALGPLAVPPPAFEPIGIGVWVDVCPVVSVWDDHSKVMSSWQEQPKHIAPQVKCPE